MNDKTPLRELKGVGDKTEKLFQKIGQGPPQLFIVPLQRLDFLRVDTAIGVCLDRHLV